MKISKPLFIIGICCAGLLLLSVSLAMLRSAASLRDKVALVRLEGPIMDAKTIVDEIKEYVKNPSVKAIVLRVDSPGGGVVPSQEIYEQVKKARIHKKVVVSMGSVAASGGYYVSAPADRIVANAGTMTGSIGVIMVVPNLKGLLDKVGVKTEVVKSGRHKDLASVFRGIGAEERQIIQSVMDDVYEQFVTAVAEGRNMSVGTVRALADGRIFSGRQAVEAGLVDELGDLDSAIKVAGKLSGVMGEPEVLQKTERSVVRKLLDGGISEEISKLMSSINMKYMYYLYMP